MNSPTALNKRGNKVISDGYTFDSHKEYLFYQRFIKHSGWKYAVHPKYVLEDLALLSKGVKIRAVRYTPDFVIYGNDGEIKHVYDVKNSFGPYGIDVGNKLRFNLFAHKYGVPVEAVVVRKSDFKSIAQCVSKPRKVNDPYITKTLDYEWKQTTG